MITATVGGTVTSLPVPKDASRRRVAGFWMANPTTLAYQTEDTAGDRITMEIEFATPEDAKARCADAIRAITDAVRSEHLLPNTKAAYLSATADLIADWIVARMERLVPHMNL